MKMLLVPVDFTPASRNAAEYAASLAKAFRVPLYLLHVFLEPVSSVEVPTAWVVSGRDLQQENTNRIQSEITYLKGRYGIEINGSAELGFTGDTINSVAHEQRADLIVMGMREGAHSRFFESTVVTAVRKTNIPILVVPQSASYVPFRHIIVAADFSKMKRTSSWALFYTLVEMFDATVQVLHV
jgi:nucleotide-binding universal stress UspA family protein